MKLDRGRRFRLAAIAIGLTAFLVFLAVDALPLPWATRAVTAVGDQLTSWLSWLTGLVPFSVAEPLVALFLVRQVVGAARGASKMVREGARVGRMLGAGLLRLGADLGITVALFYLLWGFHYARPPLEDTLGWDSAGIGQDELERLAGEMVESANAEYGLIHGSDDAGMPTSMVIDRAPMLEALRAGWSGLESMSISTGIAGGYGDPKPLVASRLLDHAGLAGIYFPWTGEAHYNRGIPPVSLPHVIAHEMSHQRGYAREDEANFIGYLVTSRAPDPFTRYSGSLFAQRQLIGSLASRDREAASALIGRRLPGVQRDLDDVTAYWKRFEGPTARVARLANDTYLKSQRVPGGIRSYARSVQLLIAYARSREGTLLGEHGEPQD